MAIDTKPNFSSKKFEQCTEDIMNLSGCTQIYGTFDMESGSTFTICDNVGADKVLTSDAGGVATWQTLNIPPAGVTAVSGGSGMNFSPITTTGSVVLGTPSSITSGSTNVSSGTTHSHAFTSSSFVTGTDGICVDGSNRFCLNDTYVTEVTLPSLYSYSGITANQSIGTLPSGETLGMVYITNTGSTTGYFNLGTTPTGDDITPYQTISVDAGDDVSVTVNMRLSLTEEKTLYVSSDDWTDVGINLQWANISYQNASIGGGEGTITGGVNGLTTSGTNIKLGGSLCENTLVDTTASYALTLGTTNTQIKIDPVLNQISRVAQDGGTKAVLDIVSVDGFNSVAFAASSFSFVCQIASATGSTAQIFNSIANISTSCGVSTCMTDEIFVVSSTEDFAGIQYDNDYCANFTCLSIPHAGWVTGQTGGGGTVTGATNLGTGTGTLYTSLSGKDLQFKTISGGTNIAVTCNDNYVGLSVTGGSGGFLGLVTKDTAEPSDLADNQWVKPEPMSTNCFNYTFDNFLDSGSTAISVNLSLEDSFLRYCCTGASAGYWLNETYERPLSSGTTWVGNETCKAEEVAVINEWVNTIDDLCYAGQKFAYQTQTIFQVDVGCCVTMPNKIFLENINLDTVANCCIFTIPAGMTGMIDSAKLIMLCNASPTSFSVSIGNNACTTPSSSYCNMITTQTIDDVSDCEVYDIMPVLGGAGGIGGCYGADVYLRIQSGSTCGNNLCANLLVEGYVY